MIPSYVTVEWPPQLLVNHTITRVNDKHSYNHSVPRLILSFNSVFNHIRWITLCYKTGFALDDLA